MKRLLGRAGWVGWLAAGLAVGIESWILVKIFVGSFLVKGMIGEEVFEAVSPPPSARHIKYLRRFTGPSTTFEGFYSQS
jgi:hypothetical protein